MGRALVIAIAILLLLPLPLQAQSASRAPVAVFVLAPDMGFGEIGPSATPNLDRLARLGAAGILNTRTVHDSSLDEAFLSIGAGNRANASFSGEIGQSIGRDELFEGATGAQVYARRTALNPQSFRMLAVNLASLQADSAMEPYDLQPGLLADLLRRANILPAAVGNADQPGGMGIPTTYHREVVGVAMDRLGRVQGGTISRSLQAPDPTSPFSVRFSADRSAAEVRRVMPRYRFIAVEDGDLVVLHQSAALFTAPAFRTQELRAITRLDSFIGVLMTSLDLRRDLLVVCSPVNQTVQDSPPLTPIVAAGPMIHGGWLSSSSTRRAGLAVLTDLAPTALDFFGQPVPPSMAGNALRSVPADRRWGAGPVWRLRSEDDPMVSVESLATHLFRLDSQRNDVQRWYVYLCQALLLLAAIAVVLPWWRPLQRTGLADWGFLVPVALPLAMLIGPFLMPGSSAMAAVEVGAITALLIALALRCGRVQGPSSASGSSRPERQGGPANAKGGPANAKGVSPQGRTSTAPLGALEVLAWLNVAAISLDLLLGQQGMITSMLSYAPGEGARYYGIGNEYMGVLVGSSVTALCLSSGRSRPGRAFAAILLFVPVLLICLPAIGAKAGGALVAVPTAAMAAWVLLGGKVTWRTLVSLAVLGILALAGMVVWDMRHAAAMSHVGRAMENVMAGGSHAAGNIALRKGLMEWRLIKYSPWSRTLLAAIAAAGILWSGARARIRSVSDERIRAILAALTVAAVTSLLFNDAGVLAAALAFVYFPAVLAAAAQG